MKKNLLYILLSLVIMGPTLGSLCSSTKPTNPDLQALSLHDKGTTSDGIFFASEESPSVETVPPYHLSEIGAANIADTLSGYDVNETVVAIIDTGAELSHEDLADNLWINKKEKNGIENVDDDNNGYVDDVYGLDLIHKGEYLDSLPTVDPVSGTAPPKYDIPEDDSDSSHGTHVSGIVGMNPSNSVGYAGVNYKTKIMILKAGSSSNSFHFANCIEAVKYAVNNGADVINMSFGSTKQSDAFASALEEAAKSCVLVAAAGNSSNASSNAPLYPASYPYIIGVMASNATTGGLWTGSNWNDTAPACYNIICPGESILSTSRYNLYEAKSGTSMASPMVAGSAAIIMGFLEANKKYDTREELLNDTKKYLYMSNSSFTYTNEAGVSFVSPRLNLEDSLQNAIQDLTLLPTTVPTLEPALSPLPTATSTTAPMITPSITPTMAPTITPTPTMAPTVAPTIAPTPTIAPMVVPTAVPTMAPTVVPTETPSHPMAPTAKPSITPTAAPTIAPTSTIAPTTPAVLITPEPTPSLTIFPPISTIVHPAVLELRVSSQKGTTIHLNWSYDTMPHTFTIYRSTKRNKLGKKIATITNQLSLYDRTIKRGKTYYYRIVVDETASNVVAVNIPKKITIKKLLQKGNNRWTIKWKPKKGITRYQIQVHRSDIGTTKWYYTKKNKKTLRISRKASVRIRAQVNISGRTYSGPFVTVKPSKKKK